MNAKELLEETIRILSENVDYGHPHEKRIVIDDCPICMLEIALAALDEQPCEKKNCKDCAFWGEGNIIKYKNEGKIYKWCGHPKMGSFYNNGIAEIETTREDFGCIFFKEQGQQPCGGGGDYWPSCDGTGKHTIARKGKKIRLEKDCPGCPDCPPKQIYNTYCESCDRTFPTTDPKAKRCPSCQLKPEPSREFVINKRWKNFKAKYVECLGEPCEIAYGLEKAWNDIEQLKAEKAELLGVFESGEKVIRELRLISEETKASQAAKIAQLEADLTAKDKRIAKFDEEKKSIIEMCKKLFDEDKS